MPGGWEGIRPAISPRLEAARIRANKEVAHLTTNRITGSTPEKAWDVVNLVTEIRSLMRLFAKNAVATRLSPEVAAAIR